MPQFESKKEIFLGKVVAAYIEDRVISMSFPELRWSDANAAINSIDSLLDWLMDTREYIWLSMVQDSVLPVWARTPGGGGGVDSKVLAFDAQTIVLTRAASLRCRAVAEVRALTTWGICYVKDANNIRWTPDEPYGAVFVAGQWIQNTPGGLEMWARQEGLNWRKDDGTIIRWQTDDEIAAAGGGGGGDKFQPESATDVALKVVKSWTNEHLLSIRAKPVIALIERIAIALDDAYRSGEADGWRDRDECEDCDEEVIDDDAIVEEGGGGGDGWRSDADALANAFGGKPLYRMSAAEARQYATGMQERLQKMLDDLNNIPGVKASGTVSVEIEVIDEEGGAA